MPLRLAFGRSTNARARLEALLRVIDWLTCALTTADWRSALFWTGANLQSRPAWGCAGDGRGASGGVSDAGDRGGCVLRFLRPRANRQQALSRSCVQEGGDDDDASFSSSNGLPQATEPGPEQGRA